MAKLRQPRKVTFNTDSLDFNTRMSKYQRQSPKTTIDLVWNLFTDFQKIKIK